MVKISSLNFGASIPSTTIALKSENIKSEVYSTGRYMARNIKYVVSRLVKSTLLLKIWVDGEGEAQGGPPKKVIQSVREKNTAIQTF